MITSDTHTLTLTNNSLLELKACATRENHAWSWKPSQLPRAGEVVELGEEPTTTTVLTRYKA